MTHEEERCDDVEMEFIGGVEVRHQLGKLEPNSDDEVSMLLLQQLGSVKKSYRREAIKAGRKIVSEVYPPRGSRSS